MVELAMDVGNLNRAAWDAAVEEGSNPYTRVVPSEVVAAARAGSWSILLTDARPVPADWFPPLEDARVLCLAAGGGQQAPILAAAGAHVTLLDASPRQLAQDAFVARRDDLDMTLVEGDMADLTLFPPMSFDLVVNPVSTLFTSDVRAVWRHCHRVLRPGGALLTGFMNPDEFVFDAEALDHAGTFIVRYPLPYVERETLSPAELDERVRNLAMFHFSHTMEDQLGGLLEAGFVITGFYEDRRSELDGNPIRDYLPSFFAARAERR
jgi:SAM-dependent methyltransferase